MAISRRRHGISWHSRAFFYFFAVHNARLCALSALAEETGFHPGAEGATAPETLRQKDCQGRALWKAGAPSIFAGRLTDEVILLRQVNLSGLRTEGAFAVASCGCGVSPSGGDP
jgi:hypothetical protein